MARNTTPSNVTSLAFAEEEAIGVLPATPEWRKLEPNAYGDFGADVDTVARAPITDDRQMKKGVVVGIAATADFENDLTDENFPLLMQGFMFADVREKATVTATGATAMHYTVASGGDAFAAGDLVFASGANNSVNNGLKVVTGSTATTVAVSGLSAETADIHIVHVGFEFASGDAEIVKGVGELPKLVTTAKNLTNFGLIPGEFVFIGGDTSATTFAGAANIGWARVKSVGTNEIVFDKTDAEYTTDNGSGKTVRVFFGKVLRNEQAALQKRRTYHFERQLGAPNPAQPSQVQAEYIAGGVLNEVSISFSEAGIIAFDLSIMGTDYFTRTASEGPLAGDRPALVESDGYSANNDVKRIRMSSVPNGASAPVPLFNFVREMDISINNNVSESRAISYAGAIDMNEGMFEVSGELTVYFANVEAASAVRNNADITLDVAASKLNKGFAIDIPLVTLGDGRNSVEANEPITIDLEAMAANGAKYDANMNHTLLITFFDYLPSVASSRTV